MKSIVILISGRGSNMEAIVDRCREEAWPARIAAVVSSRPQAAGLASAAARGIPVVAVDPRAHPTREAFDGELSHVLDRFAPDAVALAGFMRILTPGFVRRYEGRMLNVHPSLLPAFPGLHTHRRALEQGCKLHGATVHFVTADLDHGPIVVQAAVPVQPDDDEGTLAARVLEQEHLIYPLALRWWVHGRLRVHDGRVTQLDGEAQWQWSGPPG